MAGPLLLRSCYSEYNILLFHFQHIFTPLQNVGKVVLVYRHGASLAVLDKEDKSSVYWAASQNHVDCLMVLITSFNIHYQLFHIFQILLKQSGIKDVFSVNDRWDNTPLHIACSKGHLDCAVALIDAGAQIDNKNEDEQTPLHLAAKGGRIR